MEQKVQPDEELEEDIQEEINVKDQAAVLFNHKLSMKSNITFFHFYFFLDNKVFDSEKGTMK